MELKYRSGFLSFSLASVVGVYETSTHYAGEDGEDLFPINLYLTFGEFPLSVSKTALMILKKAAQGHGTKQKEEPTLSPRMLRHAETVEARE